MGNRKSSIMLIMLLLIGLFVASMWLISNLNLNFAERAMSEQRERQIADTFHASLARINAHHFLLERNVATLARTGEFLLRNRQATGLREAERNLITVLEDLPEARGGSLLFHPGSFRASAFAVHAQRGPTGLQVTSQAENLADQPRYLQARQLLAAPQPTSPFHWSEAYYKPQLDEAVISISAAIRNDQGRIVGVALLDWEAGEIIRLVSAIRVTPGSFAFLLDRENRKLSSLATAEDDARAQHLMDKVIALQLAGGEPSPPPVELVSRYPASPMQHRHFNVDGVDYALLHAPTEAGLVFGIGIPQTEIDAVLTPMRKSNLRIMLGTLSVMLLLSCLILYLVANTLRQLNSLYTDALTGLPNRERLLQDLAGGRPATLILLNIDAFREINDFFGSSCGDHVIREVAAGLLEHLAHWRLGRARLYHMHADEMAILLPAGHPERFTRWLDSLHERMATLPVHWQGQAISLQATLGLASTDGLADPPLTTTQLLPSANIAVKMARLQKLNYLIHDPAHDLRDSYEQNLLWATRLRQALEEGRMVPFFQPILNLHTGRIDKYECLVRMLDEQGNPVSPMTFLPIARRIRLYRLITRSMIDQCLARFADSTLHFSLNLACDDLLDEELSEYLLSRLQDRSLAQRAIFEILESEGIENYQQVRRFIDQAKDLGCRIAIDDFGTGYSNFEHLLRLDVDLIKIDGSLIKRLDRDPTARALTEGIVRFARQLGLQTVAEFVHSEALLQRARELGIDFAQGSHIGMPAPDPVAAALYSAPHPG